MIQTIFNKPFPFFLFLVSMLLIVGCKPSAKEAETETSEVSEETTPETDKPDPSLPANLRPLPELEKLLSSSVKGIYNFRLDRPVEGEDFFVVDDLAELKFAGNIATPEVQIKTTFELHLFSNDAEAYEAFTPVNSWELAPYREGGEFRFELEDAIAIPGGLYYYIIVDKETGDRCWIGKIQIVE